MVKLRIVVLCALLTSPVLASDLGLGLILDLNSYSLQYDDGFNDMNAERNGMSIGVRGYYFADSGWDYSLGLALEFFGAEDKDGISPEITEDFHQTTLGVLGGMNRTIVSNGPFKAGLGGDLGVMARMNPSGNSAAEYDRFFNLTFAAALPATFDVEYAKHFMVRFRGELITMEYTYFIYSEEGISIDWTEEKRQILFGRNLGIDFIVRF